MSQDLVQFDQLKADVQLLVQPTLAMTVVDVSSDEEAAAALKAVTALKNKVEARRKALKAPILEAAQRLDALAEEVSQPLHEAVKHLGYARVQFKIAEDKRRAEEARKLEAARQEQLRQEAAEREKRDAEERARREEERKRLEAEEQKKREEIAAKAKHDAEFAALFGGKAQAQIDAEAKAKEAELVRQREEKEAAAEKARIEEQARLDREAKERAAEYEKQKRSLTTSTSKNIRRNQKWRIVDESLLPREVMIPNGGEITRRCAAGIPTAGVEYYDELQAVAR